MIEGLRLIKLILLYIIAFLLRLIPNEKNSIVFICNEAGTFGGNIGPLVQRAKASSLKFKVLSKNRVVCDKLNQFGVDAYRYGSFLGIIKLSQADKVIIECTMPLLSCLICSHKKVFQMWHGANLKYITKMWDEVRDTSNVSPIQKHFRWISLNVPKYEFILATSDFFARETFGKSFNSKRVLISGYPRCDVFFRDLNQLDFVSLDRDLFKRIEEHKGKVIAYVPTWRDHAQAKEEIFPFDRNELKEFLEKNDYLMVVKKHHRDNRNGFAEAGNRVVMFSSDNDIYPLFKHVDLIISDYSSIFFDFLLTGKPVLFYTYDYDQYVKRDRLFQFDYEEFTPGRKCKTEQELYYEIQVALNDPSYYIEPRKKIQELVYGKEIIKDSSSHILNEIVES